MAEKDTFIQEVDEEYRRDRVMQIWARYQWPLIGALVILLVGVAGYEIWKVYSRDRAEAAGLAFTNAQSLAQQGKYAEAAEAFGGLANTGPDGYKLLASFQRAGQLIRAKDITGAVAMYDQIAADSGISAEYRDLARYFAALNGFDSLSAEDLRSRLGAIPPASPWNPVARELLAQVELKAGARDTARKLLTELSDDPQAPLGVRGRASELLAALGGPL